MMVAYHLCGCPERYNEVHPEWYGSPITKALVLCVPIYLFISGYGYCVAGDICGAAIKGKVLVDLCFNTEAECRKFGRRKVTIYILGGPAAAKVNIASISNKSQNKAPKNSKAKRVSQKHKPNKEGEKDSIKKVKKADVLENANKTKKDKISNKGGQEIIKKENKKTVKT